MRYKCHRNGYETVAEMPDGTFAGVNHEKTWDANSRRINFYDLKGHLLPYTLGGHPCKIYALLALADGSLVVGYESPGLSDNGIIKLWK